MENEVEKDTIYKMEIPEIIIIILIIFLWFLSIRKFTKQFERIRTTHYREIPYSYQSKTFNENKITIVKRETDSVIYAAQPKLTRSKSFPSDQINNSNSNNSGFKNNSKNCSTEAINYKEFTSNHSINNNVCRKKSTSNTQIYVAEYSTRPLSKTVKTTSGSLSPILVEFDCSPKKFNSGLISSTLNETNIHSNYLMPINSNLINPSLIPPIVRRSLLDLHRRSVEHVTSSQIQHKGLKKDDFIYKSFERTDSTNERSHFLESPV